MNKWGYVSLSLVVLYFILGGKKAQTNGVIPPDLSDIERKVIGFTDIITFEGVKQKMDPAVIAAMIHWESGGNPTMPGGSGEYGLMQIMPETASMVKKWYPDLKYNGNPDMLWDPAVNIELGTKYLVHQFQRYGRHLKFALAGYNAGTCYVLELGERKSCYSGQWGSFCNSQLKLNVNTYVLGVYNLIQRYRQIFSALYSDYSQSFNALNFQ